MLKSIKLYHETFSKGATLEEAIKAAKIKIVYVELPQGLIAHSRVSGRKKFIILDSRLRGYDRQRALAHEYYHCTMKGQAAPQEERSARIFAELYTWFRGRPLPSMCELGLVYAAILELVS